MNALPRKSPEAAQTLAVGSTTTAIIRSSSSLRIVRAQALAARDVGTVDRAGTPEFAEEDETQNA